MNELDQFKSKQPSDQDSWRGRARHNIQVHLSGTFMVGGLVLLFLGISVFLTVLRYYKISDLAMYLALAIQFAGLAIAHRRCHCGKHSTEPDWKHQLVILNRNRHWLIWPAMPFTIFFLPVDFSVKFCLTKVVLATMAAITAALGVASIRLSLSKDRAKQKAVNKKTAQIALRRSNYYRLTAYCVGSISLAASSQNPQLAGYHYSFRSAQT
ncbi:MAG: hypothetical protein WC028_01560 [Candidatus Obscuribacterales bacterium]